MDILKIKTCSLLAGGMLAIPFALQTNALAQTTPGTEPEQPLANTVNCPGSPLHGRTINVANAILNAIPRVTACDQVTTNHLASITSLSFNGITLPSLKTNDFDGLPNLRSLNISANSQITNFPSGVFDKLTNLERLSIYNNFGLTALPSGIFDELTNLGRLDLGDNRLVSLPAGVFDQLTSLETLKLENNRLTSFHTGIFDNLDLRSLHLSNNRLTALPANIFDNLPNLQTISLNNNPLPEVSIPFERLQNL